jgi:flagellar P-ring protein precursor FlgI
MSRRARRLWPAIMVSLLLCGGVQAERVKDLAAIAGVRSNQLVGYGLVVGLNGTGDQTSQAPFTVQSLKSMLSQFGISLPPNVTPQLKNVAAVSVHAELPPFARAGQTIDVTVSSIGNAKSLRGGALLMTPLRGADGNVYAVAQGNVSVGGISVSGGDGSSVTVNVPSAGRIPGGATVERQVPTPLHDSAAIVLNLHAPDFTTSTRLAAAINAAHGAGSARALDAAAVEVLAPTEAAARVAFLSQLENLTLEPGSAPARVVVNSRTGTIVIGRHVRVTAAAVTHGNLTVTIREQHQVSQPAPFSETGATVVVPDSGIEVESEVNRMFLFDPGVELGDIVSAVNQVGAAPMDLIAILEALKQAGALRAELVVI